MRKFCVPFAALLFAVLFAASAFAQTPPNGAGKVLVWDATQNAIALAPYLYVNATSQSNSYIKLGSSAWANYLQALPAGFLSIGNSIGANNGGVIGRNISLSNGNPGENVTIAAGTGVLMGYNTGLQWDNPLWGSPDAGMFRFADGSLGAAMDAQGTNPCSVTAASYKQGGRDWIVAAGAPSGPCITGSLHTRTDTGVLSVCESGVWTSK